MKKSLIIIDLIFNILILQIINELAISNVIPTLVLLTVNSLVCMTIIFKSVENKKICYYMMGSYFIKMMLLFFDIYGKDIYILPNSGYDSEMFYKTAVIAKIIETRGYTLFLKILFYAFGDNRIMFQYVNILFSLGTQILILNIMKQLKIDGKKILISLFLICFLPNNMIISSILLREPLMILLNTISLYYFIKWFNTFKNSYFIKAIIFVLLSTYFHSSMIFIILPYSFAYVFYNKNKDKFLFTKKCIFTFSIIMICFWGIYSIFGTYLFKYFEGLNDFNKITTKISNYAVGGSAYLGFLANATSPIILILSAPLKLIYFYCAPMPWDWRGIGDIIAFLLSSLIYIYILFKCIMSKNKNSLNKIIILIILTLGLVYGMSCFNTGTAIRHREKTIPFIVILYSLIEEKEKKVHKHNKTSTFIN